MCPCGLVAASNSHTSCGQSFAVGELFPPTCVTWWDGKKCAPSHSVSAELRPPCPHVSLWVGIAMRRRGLSCILGLPPALRHLSLRLIHTMLVLACLGATWHNQIELRRGLCQGFAAVGSNSQDDPCLSISVLLLPLRSSGLSSLWSSATDCGTEGSLRAVSWSVTVPRLREQTTAVAGVPESRPPHPAA